MNILLKRESFKNFKGIKDLSIDFGKVTNIFGENATGKTTVYDGFLWCLFGKDHLDRKDYEIKTLDADNNVKHGLEHQVELEFEIDGQPLVLTRMYHEKWTKTKGKAEKVFSGHETVYSINDVPVKQKEFNAKIDSLLDSELFKLISNPFYFNSLKWDKQREIILQIVGDVDQNQVINSKEELAPLSKLLENKDLSEFRKSVKASISKLNREKSNIPARIDECNNNIIKADWAALELQKKALLDKSNEIDLQITDSSKANEGKIEIQNKLAVAEQEFRDKYYSQKTKIQDELSELKEEYRAKLSEAKANADRPLIEHRRKVRETQDLLQEVVFKIEKVKRDISVAAKDIETYQEELKEKNLLREKLVNQFKEVDSRVFNFDETSTICPTCGREYEINKIEEIKEHAKQEFNKRKTQDKMLINKQGISNKAFIDAYTKQIEDSNNYIDSYNSELKELEIRKDELDKKYETLLAEDVATNKVTFKGESELLLKVQTLKDSLKNIIFDGMNELQLKIKSLQDSLEVYQGVDNTSLLAKKKEVQIELDSINRQLAKQESNKQLTCRISELEIEERDLSNKIAELEGHDFMCEEFIRSKVELLEERINSKFKTLKFKLFNNLNNGGLEECCEALINGIPFGSANNASQVNAGLEIINTLCDHYSIYAPIFIDNREGVNELVDTKSQVVNLIVSNDKPMKVEVEE